MAYIWLGLSDAAWIGGAAYLIAHDCWLTGIVFLAIQQFHNGIPKERSKYRGIVISHEGVDSAKA